MDSLIRGQLSILAAGAQTDLDVSLTESVHLNCLNRMVHFWDDHKKLCCPLLELSMPKGELLLYHHNKGSDPCTSNLFWINISIFDLVTQQKELWRSLKKSVLNNNNQDQFSC